LGTKRDSRGINKFTYHPEFRIPYIKGEVGLYEDIIKSLNSEQNRQTMAKKEASRYGPVYYFLAAIPYKIFFNDDLFIRVFSSRFISVILSMLNIFFIYLISKEIFSKEYLRLSLTFLVAFQPMFSFVSAGVNSDNFFNLIFTLILWFCLKIFLGSKRLEKNNFSLLLLIGLIITLTLGFYTKKQIFISLPIIAFSFFLSLLTQSRKTAKQKLGILGLIGLFFLIISKGKIGIPEYNPYGTSKLVESFFQYIFWHLRHTVAETIPWYWGVFNWLGVTLPRWVNRVQARLLIFATFGILVYFIKQIRKKFSSKNNLKIVFLLSSAFIYYFSVICWDYFFRKTQGFSFGIQGRYFFPTIVSHMLFVILGLANLIPEKLQKVFSKIVCCWWLVLSLIGLYTASSAYYQVFPLFTFLNQASQYKPEILKGLGLVVVFLSFIISSAFFVVSFFRFNERKIK